MTKMHKEDTRIQMTNDDSEVLLSEGSESDFDIQEEKNTQVNAVNVKFILRQVQNMDSAHARTQRRLQA